MLKGDRRARGACAVARQNCFACQNGFPGCLLRRLPAPLAIPAHTSPPPAWGRQHPACLRATACVRVCALQRSLMACANALVHTYMYLAASCRQYPTMPHNAPQCPTGHLQPPRDRVGAAKVLQPLRTHIRCFAAAAALVQPLSLRFALPRHSRLTPTFDMFCSSWWR